VQLRFLEDTVCGLIAIESLQRHIENGGLEQILLNRRLGKTVLFRRTVYSIEIQFSVAVIEQSIY
jgi:hypothetical protein